MPGLVLAGHWTATDWVLLDSERQRCDFLETVIAGLGWGSRVVVKHARAEDAGRDPRLRGRFDLVTARSFGPPGVVAECAAPFLRLGGELVVSDPPTGADDRWPAAPLAMLGLAVRVHTAEDPHLTVLTQAAACPERFPRRPAPIAKRPLF